MKKEVSFYLLLVCVASLTITLLLIIVLSTLAQIEDASVAIGDPANFTCNAERRDTGFSISWKVDGRSYTCDASDANSEDNHCFTNDTLSVLRIQDTTSLGTGSHTVECILDHSIPPEFENDCSLLPDPQCDDVIRSATLNLEPTIVSTSESNTHTHTHIHIHSRSTFFSKECTPKPRKRPREGNCFYVLYTRRNIFIAGS